MYPPILRVLLEEKINKGLDAYATFLCCFFLVLFFLIFFLKAYVAATHLNCINKLIQFEWIPTTIYICLYREVDKRYTGCNWKTTELFDCVLIEVCGN